MGYRVHRRRLPVLGNRQYLTRKISASDAVQIAAAKGLTAGVVNLAFAFVWLEALIPDASQVTMAGLAGFCGYGLSLVLFVLALRHLGTARTGGVFLCRAFCRRSPFPGDAW